MDLTDRLTPTNALAALAAQEGPPFLRVFAHGSLEVEVYRPRGVDLQQPHTRDELYVVISGRGEFVHAGRRQPVEPGEVLFVPAGAEHRFEAFSDDFATWVFFYGPEGGEALSAPAGR
jgi:mannose-6-phosphate isomerase-like protein (cupin superfamily)